MKKEKLSKQACSFIELCILEYIASSPKFIKITIDINPKVRKIALAFAKKNKLPIDFVLLEAIRVGVNKHKIIKNYETKQKNS